MLLCLHDENGAVGVPEAVITDTSKQSPLEEAIVMAAHDEKVGSELVRHLADDAPGVPDRHLHLNLHLVVTLNLAHVLAVERAELLRLLHHGVRHLPAVPVHRGSHLLREQVPGGVEHGVGGRRRADVEQDDGVPARGRGEAAEAPPQRAHALVALVHRHQDAPPLRRRLAGHCWHAYLTRVT
uniref:Uncharacterized protein n=1 Tax=Arundo donax TaxID=35708 RepID=A0A0A8Y6F8_ARUDO